MGKCIYKKIFSFCLQPPMNLLTPDAFSSPRRPEDSDLPEEDSEEGSVSKKVRYRVFQYVIL